ncbi:diacylglycerol kinase [Pseudorhodoferax sp. LjRoot39]|uniref:diacylglycerol kinase n=1 Tax=Pseudorhodoferax sp. LjRoot39 TaxID=3342328 RepID=UPI003ECFA52E
MRLANGFRNPHKQRRGLVRLWFALQHSLHGLRAGWNEKAFRLEALLAVPMLPLAIWLGRSWLEVAVLAGSVVAVLVVELLNTAVESTIDRVGPQWHALSKRAKDLGSAAVLLTLLLCGGIWATALAARIS